MKTNVNIFNSLNESFEKSIKKKITINEAKTIYTDEKGEDYKELTKAQYLNLGKKYGEKVNNYEVKNLKGKFYILKSDYEDLINESSLNEDDNKTITEWQILFDMESGIEDFYTENEEEYKEEFQNLIDNGNLKYVKQCIRKDYVWSEELDDWDEDWVEVLYDEDNYNDYEDLINESALNESNTDEIATKFGIKENLDKLTNDLMAIDGVSKVEYDLAGLYDNIGFNILVFDDINSDDTAEYYTKRRNMFKEIVKTFEADGVNIEKEETEDNDSYFYFVSYSTNWNMNESSLNEEESGLNETRSHKEDNEKAAPRGEYGSSTRIDRKFDDGKPNKDDTNLPKRNRVRGDNQAKRNSEIFNSNNAKNAKAQSNTYLKKTKSAKKNADWHKNQANNIYKKKMNESDEELTADEMWDRLLDMGTSEETLQIITSINGYSTETLLDVLYAQYGYRSFDQLDDEIE